MSFKQVEGDGNFKKLACDVLQIFCHVGFFGHHE
jgi:hypothetical protein